MARRAIGLSVIPLMVTVALTSAMPDIARADRECPRYTYPGSSPQEVMAAYWSCVSDAEIADKTVSNFQRDIKYERIRQEYPEIAAILEDPQSIYVTERDVILAEVRRRQAAGHAILLDGPISAPRP